MGLGQLIREQFHFRTSVPQWKEKRFLFAPEKEVMPEMATIEAFAPEERIEEVSAPGETLSALFRGLDRNYKRLRRKLKRERLKGKEFPDSRWLKQLEEINEKLEKLESEL